MLDANGRNNEIQSVRGTYSRKNKRMIQIFTEDIISEPGKLYLNLSKHFVSHLPNSQQTLGNWKT